MALTPVAPSLGSVTNSGFTITVNSDGNPTPPATFYAFKVVANATIFYVNSLGALQPTLVWVPALSLTVTNASPNTLHAVSLIAADDGSGLNASVEGPSASATTLASVPVSMPASNVFSTTLMTNWGANNNPAGTQFDVQLSTDANFILGVVDSGWITTTSYIFNNLMPNTPYYMQVRARNSALIPTSFVALPTVTTPIGPDTVKAIRVYNLLVNRGYLITWSPNQELNIASYKVYRSGSPTDDASFDLVGTALPPATSFLDTVPFSFGITWYWKVLAVDAGGNFSDIALTVPAHEQTFHSFEEQPFPTTMTSTDFVSDEAPTGAVDGVNLLYTTAFPYRKNTVEVFLNGVRMIRGTDFIEGLQSQQITFTDAPDLGGIIRVNYTRFGA